MNTVNDNLVSYDGSISKIVMAVNGKPDIMPFSVRDYMQRRVDVIGSTFEDLSYNPECRFINRLLLSSDGVVYSREGRIKIVHGLLQGLTGRDIKNGAFVLSEEEFKRYNGFEFLWDMRMDYSQLMRIPQEAVENPLLLYLAEDDKSLLEDYVNAILRINPDGAVIRFRFPSSHPKTYCSGRLLMLNPARPIVNSIGKANVHSASIIADGKMDRTNVVLFARQKISLEQRVS